jgi:hypothetical protein
MSTAGRRAAWLRYDAKRKADEQRKLKERARTVVRGMLRRGELVRTGTCVRCPPRKRKRRTVFHHPDYTRPREVLELCKKCHRGCHPRGGLFGGGVR